MKTTTKAGKLKSWLSVMGLTFILPIAGMHLGNTLLAAVIDSGVSVTALGAGDSAIGQDEAACASAMSERTPQTDSRQN